MTVYELDGRIMLKWGDFPGWGVIETLKRNGFHWYPTKKAWGKEQAPGLRESILKALGINPRPMTLPNQIKPMAAHVEAPATYRATGEWPNSRNHPACAAIPKYMRAMKLTEITFKVEHYENNERWEPVINGVRKDDGPYYRESGLHLIYRHKSGMLAINYKDALPLLDFHCLNTGDTITFDKGFNKKGVSPKMNKEQ